MSFTQKALTKLEKTFRDQGFTVRYEKGNFTSGYCILKSKKVVIVNKYYSRKAKIMTLMDIQNKLGQKILEENLVLEPEI